MCVTHKMCSLLQNCHIIPQNEAIYDAVKSSDAEDNNWQRGKKTQHSIKVKNNL